MIRVLGVQKSDDPNREFVLLQNQGLIRQMLRGHCIATDAALDMSGLSDSFYFFPDREYIHTGCYVMLKTGSGIAHWGKGTDGSNIFVCYMGREKSLWNDCEGPIHVLNLQHTMSANRIKTSVS